MQHIVKTVCTIGPASLKEEIFEQLFEAGMDIVRLNFSHANKEQLVTVKEWVAKYNQKYNRQVKLMMDLQGPRMRVGVLMDEGVELKEGSTVTFSTDQNNDHAIFINDPYLHEDIQINHPIFLMNGLLELLVVDKKGKDIITKVIRGGTLYSRKAVNVPETNLTTRGLTEKDKADIAMGLEVGGIDIIAMSFVKDRQDVDDLRKLINNPSIQICTKLEIKQALNNLDEIVDATDMMMVARGDLGTELPVEEIPLIQKDIIRRCKMKGKPTIVATQMLLSMVNQDYPTRAEISDIANAVFDGASAVMLSEETAFGKYPVLALKTLRKTALRAEEFVEQLNRRVPLE